MTKKAQTVNDECRSGGSPVIRALSFIIAAFLLSMPIHAETISFSFEGVVQIDRGDVQSLEAPCKDMVITWMCPYGMKVSKGDPIIRFDTSKLQARLALAEFDERRSEARMSFDNHRLRTELEALKEERTSLEADLAVVEASLRKERAVDAAAVALRNAQYQESQAATRNLRREVTKKETLAHLGQIAADELTTARIELGKSEQRTELSRLEWERESNRIDHIEVARLELAEQEVRWKLGRVEGEESSDAEPVRRGIEKRIEAVEKQIESKQSQNQAELDRARNDRREFLRNSFDHTPVNFIEIFGAGTSNAVRRIAFGPSGDALGRGLPEGFQVDDGSEFQAGRGYGWDGDLRGQMKLREKGSAQQRGVALLRGPDTWRCRLEPGTYRLRIGVGDEWDWHGARIRHGGRTLLSRIKIDAWEVLEETVRVDGDELALTFGDDLGKAVRAPADGVTHCRDRLTIGQRVRWASWPVAYFSPRDRFSIEGLVHQDLVGLMKEAEHLREETDTDGSPLSLSDLAESGPDPGALSAAPESRALRIAIARQGLATNAVAAETIAGALIPCNVKAIDNTAVEIKRGAQIWWWGDEKKGKDLIASKVILVPRSHAMEEHLHLGESVRCTASITVAEGMRPVPGHLVVEEEAEAHVVDAATGGRLEVEGFRVGKWFVVTAGLDAQTQLAFPDAPDPEIADAFRFAGEVVAGKKTEVGLSDYWGRIKDLVPDGSTVEEGQLIVTLVNPSLEARRQEIKEAKTKARERYLVAMETRRVKTIESQLEHDDKVLSERRARLELRGLEEQDSMKRATARSAVEQAALEAREAGGRYDRYRKLVSVGNGKLESARIVAEKANHKATRAQLDLISATRQTDRLQIIESQRKWLDAVDVLSGRAGALRILRMEEHVSRLKAEANLYRALEGSWREIAFERNKQINAPASGRLFYLTGWDDHARARIKYKKDFPVWAGDAIAQILDMSELGMEASLPEKMYRRITPESKVIVGFDPAPGVEIEGRIDTIGDAFFMPDDYSLGDQAGLAATSLRAFRVKVLFSPPMELAAHLIPGTKGYVWFP